MSLAAFIGVDLWSRCLSYCCSKEAKQKIRRTCTNLSCTHFGCWSRWRGWLSALLVILFCIMVVIWVPIVTYQAVTYQPLSPFKAWYYAMYCVIGALGITLVTLRQHWVNYTKPDLQRYIIRIAFFVPTYGFRSWLILYSPKGAPYFNALQAIYEAYALYCFYIYLVNFLKMEYSPLKDTMAQRAPRKICCCSCKTPRHFITWCYIGVIQYLIIRIILTFVIVVTELIGVYGEGRLVRNGSFLYITIINILSQIVAAVHLMIFYRGTSDLLQPLRPLLKFAAIKVIIFITSFQGVFINILGRANVIKEDENNTFERYGFNREPYTGPSTGIQNFIICIEMLVASIAYFFIFSYKPYVDPPNAQVPFVTACIKPFKEDNPQLNEEQEVSYGDEPTVVEVKPSEDIEDRNNMKDNSIKSDIHTVLETQEMKGVRLKIYRSLLEFSCIRWHCWIKWRTWLTVAVVVVYSILLLVFLPLMIFGLYAVHAEIQFSAWFVSAVFVLLTIPIFLANLLQHLYNYTKPQLQAYIVRILWIVPIYSIDSWFGLKFPSTAIGWSTVRECYESYALYNFLIYLLNFLEEEYVLSETMATRPPVIHPVPFCCCKPWPTGRRFIRWCKVAVLQYAVIRPILTVIAIICQSTGVYDEGHIRPDKAFVYIAAANGISQGLALYGLVYFYKGMKDLLKPLNPVLKFGAIKAIIFFTFWQALIISFLVKINVIQESVAWKKYGFEDVANSIQDFIICVEMLIAAIGFYFIFSHKPYVDPAAAQIPCLSSFLSMVDVRDIYGDVKENFVDPIPVPRLPRRIQARNRGRGHMEDAPLIGNESDNISGYESGGERGMQGERLGSGEASLIILSVSQERERVRVEHVREDEEEEEEEEDDDDCIIHQDSDQEGALIRERRNNSSLEHSDVS